MSQTQALKLFREISLPNTLEPYAIYMIAPVARPDYVEIYVTDSIGLAKRVINQADIELLISNAISSARELLIVANITQLNELSPSYAQYVYVVDATDDSSVSSGGATYLYDVINEIWIKISEAESLDVVLQWSNIQGGPSSSPEQIDSAVAAAHTHDNKIELDKIGEDGDGNFLYDNKLPLTGWSSTSW